MASSPKRVVELRSGKKKVVLESGEGHVWMRIGSGTTGFPLHDAKKEAAMLEELLQEWQGHGYVVVKDTGSAAPKKAAPKKAPPKKKADAKTASAKDARWIAEADEVLTMWAEDEYDNLKDAILDARSMLKKPPAAEKARVTRLTRMLATATKHLADLVAEDPTFAAYARGLLPKKVGKKKTAKKKTAKKKTAKKK